MDLYGFIWIYNDLYNNQSWSLGSTPTHRVMFEPPPPACHSSSQTPALCETDLLR